MVERGETEGEGLVEAPGGRRTASPPANPRRFSGRYGDCRVSSTNSETRSLASANHYGIHLERDVLALDWSRVRCESCGHEAGAWEPGTPMPSEGGAASGAERSDGEGLRLRRNGAGGAKDGLPALTCSLNIHYVYIRL